MKTFFIILIFSANLQAQVEMQLENFNFQTTSSYKNIKSALKKEVPQFELVNCIEVLIGLAEKGGFRQINIINKSKSDKEKSVEIILTEEVFYKKNETLFKENPINFSNKTSSTIFRKFFFHMFLECPKPRPPEV